MSRILLALALSAAALPALAAGPDMVSCADFANLDDAGKAEAVAPTSGGMMASGGDGMMASDAEGAMASEAEGAMASEAEGAMASGDGMMAHEGDPVAEATAACAAHPDLTVGAAMQRMP